LIPVVNIRGTNGSGKSHLIRGWMKQGAVPHPRRANLIGTDTLISVPKYYVLQDGGIVVGPYTADCGGCDRLENTEEVRKAILAALQLKPRYVIFEGVIISTVYESWYQFSRKVGGMHWVYLDTPEKICLQRVAKRNDGTEFNQQLIRDKIRNIEATRRKAIAAGEHVTTLRWKTAAEEFRQLMARITK
jgi:hypothetical protein